MITIITRDNCAFCTKAKSMLAEYPDLLVHELEIGKDIDRDDILDQFPEQKMLPIILDGDDMIGGFVELTDYLADKANEVEVDKPDTTTTEFRTFFKKFLLENDINISFEKTDGTIRKMRCTLNSETIRQQLPSDTEVDLDALSEKREKTFNPDVQSVWDLDLKQWRSFRYDRLISYNTYPSEVANDSPINMNRFRS